MKTIRTILATFGVTTLLYGLFALLAMRLDFTFTGRSIYQLFRETGFAALVLGIGCILSFVIMTIAIVAFRDDGSRKKRDLMEEDSDEAFLEEETVPEERADEADETWSPEMKRKQRKALQATDEAEAPNLFDEDDEDDAPAEIPLHREVQAGEPEQAEQVEEPEEPKHTEPDEPIEAKKSEAEDPEEEELPAKKKRCSHCGALIDADSAFCNCCGKRV